MTIVRITLSNSTDVQIAEGGLVPGHAVRSVEVDAVADTGAITLVLPRKLIEQLGVPVEGSVEGNVADGPVQ